MSIALSGVVASIRYTQKNHQLEDLQNAERRDLANQANEAVNRATESLKQNVTTAGELNAAYVDLAETKTRLFKVEKRTDHRVLTENQKGILVSLLKRDGPQELYLVRAPDPESQHYADEIDSALSSAGWKAVTQPYNWGTWLTYPDGVEIMVEDTKNPPRGHNTSGSPYQNRD